jgi:hypothetical protein
MTNAIAYYDTYMISQISNYGYLNLTGFDSDLAKLLYLIQRHNLLLFLNFAVSIDEQHDCFQYRPTA